MKMKKTLAVLLALTMCLSLLPMSAFAGLMNKKLEIVVGFIGNDKTLNLTTWADNSLTLTMPDETVEGGYDKVTVAVKRWEDGSTPVLDYYQTYDGGDALNFSALLSNYFEGFCGVNMSKTLNVTCKDGSDTEVAAYSLNGAMSDKKGVFIAEPTDNASTVWSMIQDDGNRSITKKADEDSYIVLASGSSIQMYDGILTVDGKLKLDRFDNLDNVAKQFAAHMNYTDDGLSDDAFKFVFKAGTTLAVGTDLVTLLRDVTITLNGDGSFVNALGDSDNDLSTLYYSLVTVNGDPKTNVNGTSLAEAAVSYINYLFAAIAAQGATPLELVIDFGSSAATAGIVGQGEQYTEATASEAIAQAVAGEIYMATGDDVTIGSENSKTQITVKENTAIVVESSETAGTGAETVSTSKITYTDATTNNPQTAYVVSTSNSATNATATVALVAEKFEVDGTVNDGTDDDKPTSYVDLTKVITSIAAEATVAKMEQIATVDTTWTLKLDDSAGVTPAAVDSAVVAKYGEVANKDTTAASKYVDVQPVMTVTAGSALISEYNVPNDQLAAGAKFQYTIEGLTAGKIYHIYHKRADGVEDLGDRIANSAGKVTIELTSFSPIVAVPLTAPTPGSYGAEIVSMNSYLGEFFILNLYVKTAEAAPTFHFERDCTPYTYTLLQSADKSKFVNNPKATYYVEEITTTDPVKNALDITNAYKGKAMESGYHYYMVSVKLYTAFLDQDVIMSMEDGLGNGMTIKDYSYNGGSYTLGSNNVAATQAHSFVDYLGMMNTYYTKESDAETAGYYSDLYTGLTAAAAAAREVAAPGS